MRGKRATQSLSYPIRLPDVVQADALRLLDVSREVLNATVVALWDRLDEFGTRETKYAYKQIEEMISSPLPHGHRQWRCEAEQAGTLRSARGTSDGGSAVELQSLIEQACNFYLKNGSSHCPIYMVSSP